MFKDDFALPRLLGYVLGYATSYVIFTSGLFIVLTLAGRFPPSLGSSDFMLVTASVALSGFFVRRAME